MDEWNINNPLAPTLLQTIALPATAADISDPAQKPCTFFPNNGEGRPEAPPYARRRRRPRQRLSDARPRLITAPAPPTPTHPQAPTTLRCP